MPAKALSNNVPPSLEMFLKLLIMFVSYLKIEKIKKKPYALCDLLKIKMYLKNQKSEIHFH